MSFALGFVCGFAVCFWYAKWAVRRIGRSGKYVSRESTPP
jgi:hypothetical protein